jgi:hypothetical protein
MLDTSAVLRYDEVTGAPAPSPGNSGATFIPTGSGGLSFPDSGLVGPDGNLYVSSGFYKGFFAILRYDNATGAPLPTAGNSGATFGDTAAVFAQEVSLAPSHTFFTVRTMLFGPDGNLYVAAGDDPSQGWVDRFDGKTGAYLGKFVTDDLSQNGGLENPQGMLFGPDGKGDGKLDLYVASSRLTSSNNNVKRYDGRTGQFLGEFVVSGSGGLDHAAGITFGPDGNLYVASGGWGDNGGIVGLAAVLRYEGPTSPDQLPPGTFLGTFVQPGSGGLNSPFALLFGPDGNADGQQDLYVGTFLGHGTNFKSKNGTSAILRYDGVTGAFIDAFVPFGSDGMDNPGYMAFTETNPTTLAFNGRSPSPSATAPTTNLVESALLVAPPKTEIDSAWLGSIRSPSLVPVIGPPEVTTVATATPGPVLQPAQAHTAARTRTDRPVQPIAGATRPPVGVSLGVALDQAFADLDDSILADGLSRVEILARTV